MRGVSTKRRSGVSARKTDWLLESSWCEALEQRWLLTAEALESEEPLPERAVSGSFVNAAGPDDAVIEGDGSAELAFGETAALTGPSRITFGASNVSITD